MSLGVVLTLLGIGLYVLGWLLGRFTRNAVVVTGEVVAMRRETHIGEFEENEPLSHLRHLQEYDVESGRNVVFLYKPIVRFWYLDGAQEAVVQEPSVCKPTLHVSMEIAFDPKDPKTAWRPAKHNLLRDFLMFIGACMMIVGILGLFGLLPFDAQQDIPVEEEMFFPW